MGFVGKLMEGSGIHMYYVIGVLIFVALFILILIRTILIPKSDLLYYKRDILDIDEHDAEKEQ